MRISHECLYQWIYAKPQRALDLRQYLARGRKRRTRKKGRKAKGPRIPMRVPIADRPEAVGSRKGFGHFESDTVVGAAPSRRCMNTQVERRSRRLFPRPSPTCHLIFHSLKSLNSSAKAAWVRCTKRDKSNSTGLSH